MTINTTKTIAELVWDALKLDAYNDFGQLLEAHLEREGIEFRSGSTDGGQDWEFCQDDSMIRHDGYDGNIMIFDADGQKVWELPTE